MAKSNALPIEYIQFSFEDALAALDWTVLVTEWSTEQLDRLRSIHMYQTKDGKWQATACLEREQK